VEIKGETPSPKSSISPKVVFSKRETSGVINSSNKGSMMSMISESIASTSSEALREFNKKKRPTMLEKIPTMLPKGGFGSSVATNRSPTTRKAFIRQSTVLDVPRKRTSMNQVHLALTSNPGLKRKQTQYKKLKSVLIPSTNSSSVNELHVIDNEPFKLKFKF